MKGVNPWDLDLQSQCKVRCISIRLIPEFIVPSEAVIICDY
jgi:hypothetical protein